MERLHPGFGSFVLLMDSSEIHPAPRVARMFKNQELVQGREFKFHQPLTIVSRARNVGSLGLLVLGSDPINVAVPVGRRTEEEHVQPN